MCGQKRGAIEGQRKTGIREMNYPWELGKGRLVERRKVQTDGKEKKSRFKLVTSIQNEDGRTDGETER